MSTQRIDGALVVQPSAKASESGVAYYAKWRDSTRTQVKRKLGPAWIERHGSAWRKRRGRVPDGYLVPNVAAERMRQAIDAHEAKLEETAVDATFQYVANAWHAHGRDVAGWKPSTVRDRRSTLETHLLPAFGDQPVREIDRADVRTWWRGLHSTKRKAPERTRTTKHGKPDRRGSRDGRLSDRNANKLLAELRAILRWAHDEYRLDGDPTAGIRKHRELTSERPDFYSVEEVEALVGAASSAQDGLIYRVAAFAGLRRGEIVSLRWRHIDFARSNVHVVDNVSAGKDARVKDGEGRTVPLVPQLAQALAARRPDAGRDRDLVFAGDLPGRKLDGDALSGRYRTARDKAKLRPLRFHDLRHTFGSLAVDGGASLVQVQAWLGHSDVKTTMRYLHAKSRTEDAELLGAAFTVGAVEQVERAAPPSTAAI